MFFFRNHELSELNSLYFGGGFALAAIFGRRHSGKTELIRKFALEKEMIFFSAMETSESENLDNMRSAVIETLSEQKDEFTDAESFESVLAALAGVAENRRIVFVIDNYQFLESSKKGFTEMLLQLCDSILRSSRIMIILGISAMSFAEKFILSESGALYGKLSSVIRLEPFDFYESKEVLKGFSPHDTAILYGITGGIPKYLKLMDSKHSLGENIKTVLLDSSSFFIEEPERILRREARDLAFYNAILSAIAAGYPKNSQIAEKTGLPTSACSVYLNNLSSMGLVRKNTPFLEEKSRKTIYSIEDGMFRFWYTVMPSCLSQIGRGNKTQALDTAMSFLPLFMKKTFVDICVQWLLRENDEERLTVGFSSSAGKSIFGAGFRKITEIDALKQWVIRENSAKSLPLSRDSIGAWWGGTPSVPWEPDIDIIALSDDSEVLFAKCCWSDSPCKMDTMEALLKKSSKFNYKNKYLFLFSKSGFAPACELMAGELGGISLVSFEKIWGS